MVYKAVFFALSGILFLQVLSPAEAVNESEGKHLKVIVDHMVKILPWAWNVTYEREHTVGNGSNLVPVWTKLSKEMEEGKADSTKIKILAERLLALAEEIADMEEDELDIMPYGRQLISEMRHLVGEMNANETTKTKPLSEIGHVSGQLKATETTKTKPTKAK